MKKEFKLPDKVIALMKKGVRIPCPCSVEIGDDVDVNRISGRGVVFHSGTKIFGGKTLIRSEVNLGYEAPLTVVNCQIGSGVELRGGFCEDSLFLDGVRLASGAQVREGCILEEQVRGGHSVGLKQTVLFPFVTLGSLINFCDCLMAGGTDRKNHSEVGSSYIHFNYTPHQDKATPSLLGDVPRGVMLNQPPIFLGGQGGIVGPVRIGYGTVVRAGTILRKDSPEGGKLIGGCEAPARTATFRKGRRGNIERTVGNNVHYIANLIALRQWYVHIRRPFFQAGEFGREMDEAAGEKIELALRERILRLRELIESAEKKSPFLRRLKWPELDACFTAKNEAAAAFKKRDALIRIIEKRARQSGPAYLPIIRSLASDEVLLGTAWLQAIVDGILKKTRVGIPLPRGVKK